MNTEKYWEKARGFGGSEKEVGEQDFYFYFILSQHVQAKLCV